MTLDFDDIKRKVSLPDLMKRYGWTMAHGSSHSALKMTNGSQTVVIKKNSKDILTYWDVHNPEIRGHTVFDFLRERMEEETGRTPSLYQVGKILQDFMYSGELDFSDQFRQISESKYDEAAITRLCNSLKPYNGDAFFRERGIPFELLETETFKNTFFVHTFQKDHLCYQNICVKMVNTTGLVGISQRNIQFKGIIGSHANSIAASNFDKSKPIDCLYAGESMIDCISHFALTRKESENRLYVSSEGTLTNEQILLIYKIIQQHHIQQIATIFDNDRAGDAFTFRLGYYLKKEVFIDNEIIQPDLDKLMKDFFTDKIRIEKSTAKDWNDDLKVIYEVITNKRIEQEK